MNTVEVLKAARAKIEHGWCQRQSAKDRRGLGVLASDSFAVSWCATGAVRAVTGDPEDAISVLRTLVGDVVSSWNDHPDRTKEEVLALFDEAIDQ